MLDLIKHFPNKAGLNNLIIEQLRYVRCLPSAPNLESLFNNCQDNIKFIKALEGSLDSFDSSTRDVISDYLKDVISNNEFSYIQIFDLYNSCHFEHKIPEEMIRVRSDYQDYLLFKHFSHAFKHIKISDEKQFLTQGPFLFQILSEPRLSFYTLDSEGNQAPFINSVLSEKYAGIMHPHLKDEVLPCDVILNRVKSSLWQISDSLYDISSYGFPIQGRNIIYEIHPNSNNVNAIIKMKVKVHLFSDAKNIFESIKYTDYMSEMNLSIRISFGRMHVHHLLDSDGYTYQEINLQDPHTRFFQVNLDHPYDGPGIIRDYLKFEEN